MVKKRLCKFWNCCGVILSRVVAASGWPPVAVWYLWNASVIKEKTILEILLMSRREEGRRMTCSDHRQGSEGIEDPSCIGEDVGAGTESNGLIDPEKSRRRRFTSDWSTIKKNDEFLVRMKCNKFQQTIGLTQS